MSTGSDEHFPPPQPTPLISDTGRVGRLRGDPTELEMRMQQRIDYIERALEKADINLNIRLAAMNELRGAMSDLSADMATRDEMQMQIGPIRDRVEKLERLSASRSEMETEIKSTRDRVDTDFNATRDRVDKLEREGANMAGRLWALGIVWGVVIIGVSVLIQRLFH